MNSLDDKRRELMMGQGPSVAGPTVADPPGGAEKRPRGVRPMLVATVAAGMLLVCSGVMAAPDGAIIQFHFQDTGERRLMMAASNQGLVFIGSDMTPFRAFRSQAQSGERPFLWVQDIDSDRDDDYVYGGSPSFVLDAGADPVFGVLQGCDDFYLGNLLDSEDYEIFCRSRSTITVWNYDGQFLWEYSLTGGSISQCMADDVDGDGQIEFGCEQGGEWVLVDLGNAEVLQEVGDNPAVEAAMDPFADYAREAEAALNGERTFDIDGDGNAAETLSWAAGSLNINDGSGAVIGSVSVSESEIYAVAVADLDGDGTPELFLGGEERVYIVSPSGSILAEVEGNPNNLSRESRVTIESVNSNGLEDPSGEAARAGVEGDLGDLERCYRNHLDDDQFIRVGAMFYELSVNDRGRVSGRVRLHSGVANDDLEGCVEDVFDDMRFPSAEGGDGTVSVRLSFDFVDR